jgi:hypothetical protein
LSSRNEIEKDFSGESGLQIENIAALVILFGGKKHPFVSSIMYEKLCSLMARADSNPWKCAENAPSAPRMKFKALVFQLLHPSYVERDYIGVNAVHGFF